MTLERAIEILEEYQKWRIGSKDTYSCTPSEITEAIDTVVKHFKNQK